MVKLTPPGSRFVEIASDLDAVTTRAEGREVDPREVGMSAEGVDRIWDAVRGLYKSRTHPAITLCLRRHGRVVLDRAIGHSHGASPGQPAAGPRRVATPQTPFCIFSASKAVTAVLIHLLDERDLLRLDDPVAEYIPEFARHRKDWVTLRHVLTHRAGIPSLMVRDMDTLDRLSDWDAIIAELCDRKPVSGAGRRLAYHAVTGGFILGEVIRRATGQRPEAFLTQALRKPLGLETLSYGVAADKVDEVAVNAPTGLPVFFPLSHTIKRSLGMSLEDATRASNDPRFLQAVIPSGNVVATSDDLCRFFQLLLDDGELDGVRVLSRRTVRRLRVESAYFEMDLTLGFPVRYGQGVMLGGRYASLFGPGTRKAFGHYGFTNVIGWADPERATSGALLTSGKPIIANHLPKLWSFLRAVTKQCPPVRSRDD